MLGSKKRLALLLVVLPLVILAVALLYMVGMSTFEGQPRGFWQALEWAAETLSTTGYGADARWSSPVMVVFVVFVQFAGVFLVFLIFPIYLIPFLEERFEPRLPTAAPDIEGHILIYQYGPPVAALLDELGRSDVSAVVAEDDEAIARRLLEKGNTVVHGRLDDGVLERSNLSAARALVANGSDDENAAVILAARQAGFVGEILAVVEEPFHRKPMALAGANAVFTPRHVLGAALAARASERISPTVEGAQALGNLVVGEVRVGPDSEIANRTLAETDLGRRTGVSVIGQWFEGSLIAPLAPDMVMKPGAILLVAGSAESSRQFAEACMGTEALPRTGVFVLAGFGEVGQRVAQLLADAGEAVEVIDREPMEGVDLQGDILDHRLLEQVRVSEAQAVILAVDSDAATLFATVILKDFAPEVPVIARVNEAQNVERIYRAGADFALSISQVSGQILASRLLGRKTISVGAKIRVLKVPSTGLDGKHPSELRIRERTGASIVAVERGDDLVLDFDSEFRFEPADDVYVCGSPEATQTFVETFQAT